MKSSHGGVLNFFRTWSMLMFAPIAFLLLGLVLPQLEYFQRLEFNAHDILTRLRHQFQKPPDSRLYLIKIDDESIQAHTWPLPRRSHGELMQALSYARPAVVAWDIFFSTEGSKEDLNDATMIEGLRSLHAPVITGAAPADKGSPLVLGKTIPLPPAEGSTAQLTKFDSVLFPFPDLARVSKFALVGCPPGIDGVRRQIPLVAQVGDKLFPSLALQIVLDYWNVAPDQIRIIPGEAVIINTPTIQRKIPIDKEGQYYLNYRYFQADFEQSGYLRLFGELVAKYVQNEPNTAPDLAGKILLVGLTAPGSTDMGPSPLAKIEPLPMVHLNAADNFLKGDFLTIPDPRVVWAIWLILAYFTLWGNSRWSYGVAVAVPMLIILVYAGLATLLFVQKSYLLPLSMPILTFAGMHITAIGRQVIIEQRARTQFRATFAAYLSPRVMDTVLENSEDLALHAVRKPVTILFSDVRDFTTLSESSSDEEEFLAQLNEYFTVMVECVHKFDGTLHKFIGDAIMAVWGDTISKGIEQDAADAVSAALEMRKELALLNPKWIEDGKPPLRIGIGINHGTVLVGDIGSPQRKEFTVMGDPVNLASRLEGVTKEFKNDLIVSDAVRDLIADRFVFRTLGFVRVKGKHKPVQLFDVLGPSSMERPAWLKEYDAGFEQYRNRQFEKAIAHFSSSLEANPGDRCCTIYIELCRQLMETPPDENWSGVYEMTSK